MISMHRATYWPTLSPMPKGVMLNSSRAIGHARLTKVKFSHSLRERAGVRAHQNSLDPHPTLSHWERVLQQDPATIATPATFATRFGNYCVVSQLTIAFVTLSAASCCTKWLAPGIVINVKSLSSHFHVS